METVFSMLKVRFTGSLSSRRYKEQRRELLIKVVLHTIERLNYLECDGRWLFTQSLQKSMKTGHSSELL